MGPFEYVVETIEGDYATLGRTDLPEPGEPLFIAMALLPPGITIGTKLRWENLQYSILE